MSEWGLIRVYRHVKLIDREVRKAKFESGFVIKSLHQSQSVAYLHRVGLTELQVECLTRKFRGLFDCFWGFVGGFFRFMLSGKFYEGKKTAYPRVFWRNFVKMAGSTYSWMNRVNLEVKKNPFYYWQQENSLSTETISILFLCIDAVIEPAFAQCDSVTLCW